MKRLLSIASLIILSACVEETLDQYLIENVQVENEIITKSGLAQVYYWCDGNKVYLDQLPDEYFVVIDNSKLNMVSASSLVTNLASRDLQQYSYNITDERDAVSCTYMCGIINAEVKDAYANEIIYESPFLRTASGRKIGISPLFSIKLKSVNDINILNSFVTENNLVVVENDYIPLWHIVSCTRASSGNALDMANKAYESGLFEATSVDFIGAYAINEASIYNDTKFRSQWNLIGTYGLNIEAVHSITQGSPSVKVAIIDTGFQINHPDLSVNVSWDATSLTSPARQYSYAKPGWDAHGTRMAGVIGAQVNNHRGIVGIAPNVTLIPISVRFGVENDEVLKIGTTFDLARAINYASTIADVISNSWTSETGNSDVNSAVSRALTSGRDGRGCIFVQCSGNDTLNVSKYPYRNFPDVICVGNMNCNGHRYYSSVYGTHLDVIAPGTDIWTTDISNGYAKSTGTSPACAHVSAVAGLMLSVNPDLTCREVTDIIETTANKLPDYTFSTISGRNNGTWNNQVGYGLVDCYAAVNRARYTNRNNCTHLIEFDYSSSRLEMSFITGDNIAIIWDWETGDISYINASEDSPVDTTIIHDYGTTKNRHVIIAEMNLGENPTSESMALRYFELITGSSASDIDIKRINVALEYIRIVGGEDMAPQVIPIRNLPALKDLYLVRIPNSYINIYNCPSLLRFGSSRYIWGAPPVGGGIPIVPLPECDNGTVSPNVVGDGDDATWPDIPEPVQSYSNLSIANCPNLIEVSLENVDIDTFDFSGFPKLRYLYVSSQHDRIVGGSESPTVATTRGKYLYDTVSTLHQRTTADKGKIFIRAVNASNSLFNTVNMSDYYKSKVESYAADNNWNVVWGTVLGI